MRIFSLTSTRPLSSSARPRSLTGWRRTVADGKGELRGGRPRRARVGGQPEAHAAGPAVAVARRQRRPAAAGGQAAGRAAVGDGRAGGRRRRARRPEGIEGQARTHPRESAPALALIGTGSQAPQWEAGEPALAASIRADESPSAAGPMLGPGDVLRTIDAE